MEDGRRLPTDELPYENDEYVAKLERVVEAARELMKQSRERFGFVPIRYIRALEEALEALEE